MKTLDVIFESNLDLTQFSNKRLTIERVDENKYRFVSKFKMKNCATRNFAFKFSKAMAKDKGVNLKFVLGNCSSPWGATFDLFELPEQKLRTEIAKFNNFKSISFKHSQNENHVMKKGDKVICIDDKASFGRLFKGEVYTVSETYDGTLTVEVRGAYHSLDRFKKAN